jgi:hypothetical protein
MKPKQKSLLNKLTDSALPQGSGAMPQNLPSIHLTGKHAKLFHGLKPGAKFHAHIRGKVASTGVNTYSGKNEPEASLQISHIKRGMQIPPGNEV